MQTHFENGSTRAVIDKNRLVDFENTVKNEILDEVEEGIQVILHIK